MLYRNAQGTYMLDCDEDSQHSAPAAREARRLHALLGGGVVDESPIYALLTNSRLNPIDVYAQQINFMKLHNTLRAAQNFIHFPALRQLVHQLI